MIVLRGIWLVRETGNTQSVLMLKTGRRWQDNRKTIERNMVGGYGLD
jgi:hypothetical protein